MKILLSIIIVLSSAYIANARSKGISKPKITKLERYCVNYILKKKGYKRHKKYTPSHCLKFFKVKKPVNRSASRRKKGYKRSHASNRSRSQNGRNGRNGFGRNAGRGGRGGRGRNGGRGGRGGRGGSTD